jgi:hypothetical protein
MTRAPPRSQRRAVRSPTAANLRHETITLTISLRFKEGKPVGRFLMIDHKNTFEDVIAKTFALPGDPPNAV